MQGKKLMIKRRNIRVVAVVALVFVALTGARRSGGGGCDDDSSSSGTSGGFSSGGFSSSAGGTSGDYDSSTSSSTSGDVSSSSGPSYQPTYDPDASTDVRGSTTCDYDETTKKLQYNVTVSNSSTSDTFDYTFTVRWTRNSDEGLLGSDFQQVEDLGPGQSRTVTAESYYTFTEQTYYTCKVSSALKTRSS